MKSFNSEWKRKYFPFTLINAPKSFLRKRVTFSKNTPYRKSITIFRWNWKVDNFTDFYQSENYWNRAKIVLRLITPIKNVKTGNNVGVFESKKVLNRGFELIFIYLEIIIVLSLFIKCFEANTIFEWFDLEFSHARAMSNFFGFWLVRGRGEIVLRKRALDSTFCPFVFFRNLFLFFICFIRKKINFIFHV